MNVNNRRCREYVCTTVNYRDRIDDRREKKAEKETKSFLSHLSAPMRLSWAVTMILLGRNPRRQVKCIRTMMKLRMLTVVAVPLKTSFALHIQRFGQLVFRFEHFNISVGRFRVIALDPEVFRCSVPVAGLMEKKTISKPGVSPSEALESDLVSDLPFAIPTTLHHVFNVSHGAAAAQIRNEIPQVRSSRAR